MSKSAVPESLIRPFDPKNPRTHFSCGNKTIDQWFKNQAVKFESRLESRTFTCHLNRAERAVGFYSLQLGNESLEALENKPDDYTKNRTAFPAVHLAFIGVDNNYQSRGLGTFLMADVFDKFYEISNNAGVYALTLQSVGSRATEFYERLGFERYAGTTDHPKMLLPARTIVQLVEQEGK